MNHCRRLAAGVFVTLACAGPVAPAPAWAQDGDGWAFAVTSQVWLSHIAKNGFAAPPLNAAADQGTGEFAAAPFPHESSPKNDVNPQWGLQLAAQKGRLTLAGAFQYVDFTTYNEITYVHPSRFCDPAGRGLCANPGDPWAREVVDTTRLDVDVAASYFFPDVVRDRVDASLGGGFKFIHASAKRRHTRLSPPAGYFENNPHGTLQTTGLYPTCDDPCQALSYRNEVKQTSYVYGLTIPMNATTRLTRDGRWLLPLSITPMIGGETRDDRDVVYSLDLPENSQAQLPIPLPVRRVDGTTFAYGVTADATVRWIVTDTLAAYVGMRVQYIKGHETYLAYGPVLGLSFRLGAR